MKGIFFQTEYYVKGFYFNEVKCFYEKVLIEHNVNFSIYFIILKVQQELNLCILLFVGGWERLPSRYNVHCTLLQLWQARGFFMRRFRFCFLLVEGHWGYNCRYPIKPGDVRIAPLTRIGKWIAVNNHGVKIPNIG